MGERWEGPYKVKGFDEKRGGYSLQELDGRLLKDLSPIEHLKVVEKALDKEQAYEVEKIVGHRGGVNDREYQIKWKGYDELSWEQAQEAGKQQGAKRKREGVIFFFFWVLGGFVCLFVLLGGVVKCFISLFVFRKHIHAEGGFFGGDDKR